jgi:hypothetical protein
MVDTQVVAIALDGEKNLVRLPASLSYQYQESRSYKVDTDASKYNYPLSENRRILAFDGMFTKDLFTNRNFAILSEIAHAIDAIENTDIRDACRLLLSASIAQCSRLIPFRNNLTTGGPAWSVPGFWVPIEHLETNPIIHLRARLSKFMKGLNSIQKYPNKGKSYIENIDSRIGLQNLINNHIQANLVFFDPPYGDSIPYVEFSTMWNSFLGIQPNPNTDISVSNRLNKSIAWSKYKNDINDIMKLIHSVLLPNGKLLITFNNNELKAWDALLYALHNNNFRCIHVSYQIPAVISAKAQFSVEGSYVSDIYAIFVKDNQITTNDSLSTISSILIKSAQIRGNFIPINVATRLIMMEWLKNNLSYHLFSDYKLLIDSIFYKEGYKYVLKDYIHHTEPQFTSQVQSIAKKILENGPCDWKELYRTIALSMEPYGIPDEHEVRSALAGMVVFHKQRCLSFIPKEHSQHPNLEQLKLYLE